MKKTEELRVIGGKLYNVSAKLHSADVFEVPAGDLRFWALDHSDPQLLVQTRGGEASQFILNKNTYEKLKAEHVIHAVEAEWHSGETLTTDCFVAEPDLNDIARTFNLMSDFITVNNLLWAVEDREAFKDHPHYKDFFQLCFEAWKEDKDYDTACPSGKEEAK
jgi:hypothetical protein